MIVSWNWLKDFVTLDMEPSELEHRLAMSGLNHEGTENVDGDLAIDLEVTSNRPDCLGHIGVAREVAVLWNRPLNVKQPELSESSELVDQLTKVRIDCPDLCYRYTARVLRGVKIGPSPDWLAQRLKTLGIAVINNVVDITNYVLMESGQPLHAFDLARLDGPEIIVRAARPKEKFTAIDHRAYELDAGMCVIADANKPVALGGVMGGVDSEVTSDTVDLLIESAEFAPLTIRTTARKLHLHSPSSYRFERGVDPEGIDWASRRCCELILELAGGELASGVIDVGNEVSAREPIVLRLSQLPRVLGIEIGAAEVRRILTALGCRESSPDTASLEITPPTWRRDLTREIDLVEEVARIHGYDEIPEDVGVPMAPSHRSDIDRVQAKVRSVMTSAGFDEAMTASVVNEDWCQAFSPWTSESPLCASTPMLKGADRLRLTLLPSLLDVRQTNEALSNPEIELFETARVYLPNGDRLPKEQWTLSATSGSGFAHIKGVVECLVATINPAVRMEVVATSQRLLDQDRACELQIDGQRFGILGELSATGMKQFGLRRPSTVAELNLDLLAQAADLIPQHVTLSAYPSIGRDLNLVVDEAVRWSDLEAVVRSSAGECLESVEYQETYRDPKQRDGAGKKRLLFSITIRSAERTLTNEEADAIRHAVVDACHAQHGAILLG